MENVLAKQGMNTRSKLGVFDLQFFNNSTLTQEDLDKAVQEAVKQATEAAKAEAVKQVEEARKDERQKLYDQQSKQTKLIADLQKELDEAKKTKPKQDPPAEPPKTEPPKTEPGLDIAKLIAEAVKASTTELTQQITAQSSESLKAMQTANEELAKKLKAIEDEKAAEKAAKEIADYRASKIAELKLPQTFHAIIAGTDKATIDATAAVAKATFENVVKTMGGDVAPKANLEAVITSGEHAKSTAELEGMKTMNPKALKATYGELRKNLVSQGVNLG